jgi:hypothetical protein
VLASDDDVVVAGDATMLAYNFARTFSTLFSYNVLFFGNFL